MQPLLEGKIGGLTTTQMQAVQLAAITEVWKEWESFEP
jgi:hypothetical protein